MTEFIPYDEDANETPNIFRCFCFKAGTSSEPAPELRKRSVSWLKSKS